MEITTQLAIISAVVLVVGFIFSEITRNSYERGFELGYRRGINVGRSQVRAER
jgi:hypothetical protein